MFIVQTVRVR